MADDQLRGVLFQLESCQDSLLASLGVATARPLIPVDAAAGAPAPDRSPARRALSAQSTDRSSQVDAEGVAQLQLDRARRATEAVSSAAATTGGRPNSDLLAAKAAEAASCLASAADAIAEASVGRPHPQLRLEQVASDVRVLVSQLAESLALLQQTQVLEAADAAKAALAAGNVDAAATAAIRAHGAADAMLRAAHVGGLWVLRAVLPVQRASAAVVEAVAEEAPLRSAAVEARGKRAEAVPVAAQRASGVPPRFMEAACETSPGATAAAAASGSAVSLPDSSISGSRLVSGPVVTAGCRDALMAEPGSAPEEHGPAAGYTGPAPGPTSSSPEPTSLAPDPTSSAPEPTSSASEPTSSAPEPTSSAPEPTSSAPEPTSSAPEPAFRAVVPTSTDSRAATAASEPGAERPLGSRVDTAAAPAAAAAAAAAPAATAGARQMCQDDAGPVSRGGASGQSEPSAAPSAMGAASHAGDGSSGSAAAVPPLLGTPAAAIAADPLPRAAALAERSEASGGGSSAEQTGGNSPWVQQGRPPRKTRSVRDSRDARGALSQLIALADLATSADGQVPPEALHQAGNRCKVLRQSADASMAEFAAAWADPRARCSLVTLLSYAVRQLPGVSALANEPSLESRYCWSQIIDALVMSIRTAVKMTLVQCLSRAVAAAGAAAAIDGGAAAAGSVVEVEAEAKAAAEADMQAFRSLRGLVTLGIDTVAQPELQEALRLLRNAILRSQVLEHVARWAGLQVGATAALGGGAAAAASSGGGAGRRRGSNSNNCAAGTAERRARLTANLLLVVLVLTAVRVRPVAVWADALLSGPCVQRFLLLHAVSQLCAADGGPDYGLPRGARLPLLAPGDVRPDAAVAAAPLADGCVPDGRLCAELMARSFRWWARNSRARPCSDRALRAVCERAAAAASAAWRAADGETAAAAAAAGVEPPAAAVDAAVEAEGGPVGGRFAPPEAAMSLALAALECAVKLTLGGSAGSLHGLWAPVVKAVEAATYVSARHVLGPLQLLVLLPLPPLDMRGPNAGPGLLPAVPRPDLAAALDAGYVPALERTIRSEARLANTSAGGLSQVADCVVSLLQNRQGLASLMAYGEPGHVAALLATFGKVSVLALPSGHPFPLKHLHLTLIEAVHTVKDWDGARPGPADQFWWRRHTEVLAISAARRTRGSGAGGRDGGGGDGGDCSGGCGAGDAGGCDGAGGGGSGAGGSHVASAGSGGSRVLQLPQLHQLSLLAGFAAYRWLPMQAREIMGEGAASVGVVLWLQPLVHAYLQCSGSSSSSNSSGSGAAVAVADGGAAAAGASTVGDGQAGWGRVDAAGGGVHGGGDSALRREAASWRWLLMCQLQLPELLAEAAQDFYKRKREEVLPELVTALLHLAGSLSE